MRSASPFRVRLRSPAQGWVCRIRGVFPSLRERFGRWHLYRARGRKPTKVTKPPFCAGGRDLQVPERGARHRRPGKRGPSRPNRHAGGASAALRHRPTRKQGLQGLRFAPGGAGQRGECPVSVGLYGILCRADSANLGAYRVRRFAPRPYEKNAREENSMLARGCG